MQKLNLAFHKICKNPQGDWQVNPKYFWKIFDWCNHNYTNFRIYFDDGDKLDELSDKHGIIAKYCTLAIVTDNIGKKGYYSWDELKQMKQKGFTISSHSVSHSSMCWFDNNGILLANPPMGKYDNCPRGKQLLSENQIKYQLVESKKILNNHGFDTNEFVFPYGLYSDQTIEILDNLGIYKYYTTCNEKLYDGGKLVPRILIYGTKSPTETIKCLTNLIN
ncbi:polysaccharide deacetylase family protein [Patescibacteria group bacterium]|nr:polysaccharide deacetylase family protein [Patescibacteria group bacterium]